MNQLADVIDDRVRNSEGDTGIVEQAKQEWESAVDLLPQVVCLLDAGGRILRINRTAESWNLGKTQAARGLSLHQLLHPACSDDDCALRNFWQKARNHLQSAGQSIYRAEDPALRRHIEIFARSYRQPIGRWRLRRRVFAVVQIGDVSGSKRREASLRDQCADLRRQVEVSKAQHRQARELTAQLLDAQERERKRIAAEFHDGIGQTLSVIRLNLEDACRELVEASETRKLLEQLSGKMKGAIDEVRQITMDLRPSTLDDLGILATLNWFAREFRATYRHITVDLEIGVGEADIPERLKAVVYRIVQDALHNIARHGGRAAVCVRLGLFGRTLELAIEDSGPAGAAGQESANAETGQDFGLISIRDRAHFSGGDYRVMSWAGHGTLIRVRWPLD